ncbi:uncharacterized protein LOC121517624 [Cheilinus undulatus]|uniref:uncharacterized protein LOC121517624 n=1 Tax=Cheilinus undulatus TaxID=241271 RepID=UPI001BD63833|nr:uncharacterized protein LOC121517624 [Cheilinus undulatus]XP_041655499.1 uncharacterized protein LOC121517624 [Cheilinus undulatus]
MQGQNTKPIIPKVRYHPTIQDPANGEQTKTRTRQAPRAGRVHVRLPQTVQENPQADPQPSAQKPKKKLSQRAAPKPDAPQRVAPSTDGTPPTPEEVPLGVDVGLDTQVVEQVEALTRGQRTNQDWFSWRKNRITASMAHSVAHSRFANRRSQTPPTSILTAITGESQGIQTRAMSWGIENESKAVRRYQVKKSAEVGCSVSVQDCGLFIHPQRAWLAASPDGIVTDSQTGRWLFCLEVKCPYKHRDRRVEDACREDPAFCLEIQDERGRQPDGPPTYHLKESHSYFTQIQCQLAVTGLKQADLVVFTRKETAIIPVKFDSDLWEETLSKLEVFYRDAVLPHLREKKQQEPGAAWTPEL